MATAYSNEVAIGSYNRVRVKCDYSGTSATFAIEFRRTSSYRGAWADSQAKLVFNGQTKDAAYSYSGTVGTSWVTLKSGISGYTISTTGKTYNWQFTNPAGGILACSGTITLSSTASAPSGLALTVTGRTYNSFTADTKIGNWNGGTNTKRVFKVLKEKYVSGKDAIGKSSTSNSTSNVSLTVTRSGADDIVGTAFDILGASKYYVGLWANSSGGTTTLSPNTQYATPPAPLATLSKTSVASSTSNSITHTVTIVGGNTSVNSTNEVYTDYRYSIDGGSTYTDWLSDLPASPQTAKTFTFTSTYGASCKVQARQVYEGQYSEVKELSFTAQAATSPTGLTTTLSGYGKDWAKVKVSISNYGTPAEVSNRYIEGAVLATNSYGGTYRYTKLGTGTVGEATITNNSSTGSTPLIITPNTKYWYGGYARNQVASAVSVVSGTFVTLPPNIDSVSVSEPVLSGGTFTVSISYSYTAGGNAYTQSVAYKINGESENTATDTGTITLSNLPAETDYSVEVYLKTASGAGESKTITFSTPAFHKLYGSVNGKTKKIVKLYGSVNGKTKLITKMYGSVDGKTKRIW